MANFYVDPVAGDDTHAGTAFGTAWKTLSHALAVGVITPSGAGDNLYLTPGVYRGVFTVANTSFTTGSPLNVIGDVDGSHTSGTPGLVRITAWDTNDTTAPASSAALISIGSAVGHYNWSFLYLQPGKSQAISGSGGAPNHAWTAIAIAPAGGTASPQHAVSITTGSAGAAMNWTFDRCSILATSNGFNIALSTWTTATDYNANILIQNCVIGAGGAGVGIAETGSGVGFGGGVKVQNCTIFSGGNGVKTTSATKLSTTIPNHVALCYIVSNLTGIGQQAAGQVVDDGSNVVAGAVDGTITAGTGSAYNTYAPTAALGQDAFIGRFPRPYLSPDSGSPLLGLATAGTPPAYDLLNRPRPSGAAGFAAGAYEYHDGLTPTGGVAAFTGPMDHDILVPVNGAATTVSVQVQWDGSYGGGTLPQLSLIADGEIGVAAQTVTAIGASGAYRTITLASFSPTKSGYARLRLSSSGASAGVVQWKNLVIPALDTSALGTSYRNRTMPFADAQAAGGGGGGAFSPVGSPIVKPTKCSR